VTRAGSRGVAMALFLVTAGLALSGCETTAEKSARLERAAKRVAQATQTGLKITRQSTVIKVLASQIVAGAEGSAVVVTLRNESSMTLGEVPIAVSLKSASGASVYSNATPGLAKTLTSIALLPAHATTTWIDDQIQARNAASASAEVGEGKTVSGALPKLSLREVQLAEDSAEGTLANRSSAGQSELVIYAVAKHGSRIVAAGRAVLASVDAGASTPFQVFFVGDPKGAKLQLTVPPTSTG
jgi:hypothetical protein